MKNFSAKNFATLLCLILGLAFASPAFSGKEKSVATASDDAPRSSLAKMLDGSAYAKPYLPNTFVGNEMGEGPCRPDGTLDKKNRDGTCFRVHSVDGKEHFLIRGVMGVSPGFIETVFKIEENRLVKLAEWNRKDAQCPNCLIFESPEGKQYAASKGKGPNVADKKDVPQLEDVLKKAFGTIIKK